MQLISFKQCNKFGDILALTHKKSETISGGMV